MLNAIKDVALSLEGDAKQIESELLMKLLNTTNRNKESTITNLMYVSLFLMHVYCSKYVIEF
jgi:hypothetical protein